MIIILWCRYPSPQGFLPLPLLLHPRVFRTRTAGMWVLVPSTQQSGCFFKRSLEGRHCRCRLGGSRPCNPRTADQPLERRGAPANVQYRKFSCKSVTSHSNNCLPSGLVLLQSNHARSADLIDWAHCLLMHLCSQTCNHGHRRTYPHAAILSTLYPRPQTEAVCFSTLQIFCLLHPLMN